MKRKKLKIFGARVLGGAEKFAVQMSPLVIGAGSALGLHEIISHVTNNPVYDEVGAGVMGILGFLAVLIIARGRMDDRWKKYDYIDSVTNCKIKEIKNPEFRKEQEEYRNYIDEQEIELENLKNKVKENKRLVKRGLGICIKK